MPSPFNVAGAACPCTSVAETCAALIMPLAESSLRTLQDVRALPRDCAARDWTGQAADLYTEQLAQLAKAVPSAEHLAERARVLCQGNEM